MSSLCILIFISHSEVSNYFEVESIAAWCGYVVGGWYSRCVSAYQLRNVTRFCSRKRLPPFCSLRLYLSTMASTSFPAQYGEKASPAFAPAPPETVVTSSPLAAFVSAASPFVNSYGRFASWRSGLGLTNPGTTENMQREVKSQLNS